MEHIYINLDPPPSKGENLTIAGRDFHHLIHVQRYKTGDQLWIVDINKTRHLCKIQEINKNTLKLIILESQSIEIQQSAKIKLAIGIIRQKSLKWIIEKSTEIGICDIYPVKAQYSQKHNVQWIQSHQTNLQRIMEDAGKQSGQVQLTQLHQTISFSQIKDIQGDKLFFHKDPDSIPLKHHLVQKGTTMNMDILIIVGPEGGWNENEVAQARENQWNLIHLGPNIWKSETAALSAIAFIKLWGEV